MFSIYVGCGIFEIVLLMKGFAVAANASASRWLLQSERAGALLAIACLFLMSSGSEAQLATGGPLPSGEGIFGIQDALALRTIADEGPALSPDGKYIAYWVSYRAPDGNNGSHQELWVIALATKELTLIKGDCTSTSKMTWSPDGRHLAFYDGAGSGSGIWVWSLASRSLKLIVTGIQPAHVPGLPSPAWSTDSRSIFAQRTAVPAPRVLPATTQEIFVYHSANGANISPEESEDSDSSIFEVDVATGEEKLIVRRHNLRCFVVSPNGKYILLKENERLFDRPAFHRIEDIVIVTINTGSVRVIARDFKNNNYLLAAGWSPDGNTFGIGSIAQTPLVPGDSSKYYAIDAQTGSMRTVFVDDHPQAAWQRSFIKWVNSHQFVVRKTGNGRELWIVSIDGRQPYRIYASPSEDILGIIADRSSWGVWQPKLNTLVILARRDSDMKIVPVWINYATGSSVALSAILRYISLSSIIEFPPQGINSPLVNVAVLTLEDPSHPPDLWSMSGDGSLTQVTQINPRIANRKFGTVHLLQWKEDGKQARAILILPSNYVEGRRYPTIVTQYPAIIHSRTLFSFGSTDVDQINQQLYATRGYAVLIPDISEPARPELADGAGVVASENPNVIKAFARQVNAALDYGIQQGYVDPKRLGIIGISNGGYGVMSTIVSTNRFRAAIARAPLVDTISDAMGFHLKPGDASWGSLREEIYGVSLWQNREIYIANSPLFFLDKAHTPLLLIVGMQDVPVTPSQAEEAYVALKLLGKEVTLVEYAGEGHADSRWTYPHRLDELQRILQFFDEHLKSP